MRSARIVPMAALALLSLATTAGAVQHRSFDPETITTMAIEVLGIEIPA